MTFLSSTVKDWPKDYVLSYQILPANWILGHNWIKDSHQIETQRSINQVGWPPLKCEKSGGPLLKKKRREKLAPSLRGAKLFWVIGHKWTLFRGFMKINFKNTVLHIFASKNILKLQFVMLILMKMHYKLVYLLKISKIRDILLIFKIFSGCGKCT